MTKQQENFSLENLDRDIHSVICALRSDISYIETLLQIAKSNTEDREIAIRREIRPLAVELLYFVIGTPKTMKEILDETDEQEGEDDR